MAIAFSLQAHCDAPVDHVFRTLSDTRRWATIGGVELVGPSRPVVPGDRIDARLRVLRRTVLTSCVVRRVNEPTSHQPGQVDIRSTRGPFDARMTGLATPSATGCDLSVEVRGHGRGSARLLEGPLEVLMRGWGSRQLRHLVALAARTRGDHGAGS
jgi:hypothetical protein